MSLLKLFNRKKTVQSLVNADYLERLPMNPEALALFHAWAVKEHSVENLDAFLLIKKHPNCSPFFRHLFFNRYYRSEQVLNLGPKSRVATVAQLTPAKVQDILFDVSVNLLETWSRFESSPEGLHAIQLLKTMKMPKQ